MYYQGHITIAKRIEEDIRRYGLNTTEFAVPLLFHKGDQPIQKIGDKVLYASGSITYVVDKLEKKKFVERKPCPENRHVTYAAITEDGRKFMNGIFPKHKEAIHDIFSGLDADEKMQVIQYLKKLGIYAQGV